jgi:hypothetical protein
VTRQHNYLAVQAHQINWRMADIHTPHSRKGVSHLVQHSRNALYSSSKNLSTEEPKTRHYERRSNRFDLRLSPLRVDPDGSLYTSSSTKTYLRDYCLTGDRWTQFIYRGICIHKFEQGASCCRNFPFPTLNTEAVAFPFKHQPTFEATLRPRN